MDDERKIVYIKSIINLWAPLLEKGQITLEEFKKEVIDAVQFHDKIKEQFCKGA